MQAVFEVHNQLGPGYSEDIYENALINELRSRDIPFEAQKTVNVTYKGKTVGTYRMDLVIDGKIILELKAVSQIQEVHRQQVFSYLKATGLRLGIVINFGASKVEYGRVVN